MSTSKKAVASNVQFSELAGLLERISHVRGTDKKKSVLLLFIKKWREVHLSIHKDHLDTNDSFYPAMRLILPQLEKQRAAYGIKESALTKLMIEVLCISKDSPDALSLLHYKNPKTVKANAGDFASIAYNVLKNRCPEHGVLTVENVNDCLDSIAANNSSRKKDLVKKSLLYLMRNLSAVEQKWLIRMIVKDLKIGLSQASILGVYHHDAEEFYNVNNDLEKMCHLLRDPSVHLHEIGISVFSPFTPMLGERAFPNKIEELVCGPYFIETKYDGERMMLHMSNGEFKFFSRSGNEYTNVFGAGNLDGTLTPFIIDCFNKETRSCILDGEMLGYHAASKTYGTKGENFDIKSKDVARNSGYEPCFYVFDILLYNDKVLTNVPLRDRITYLDKVFTPLEGKLGISRHSEGHNNQDCIDALNSAIDGREEGIMVKDPTSVYKPNTRKGGWFKIKPEYIAGLMDQLDLLIVGGYFGVGKRGGLMSHFLCALAVPNPTGGHPEVFYSFCKIGSGYTRKELNEYNQRLVNHWQTFDKTKPPHSLVLAPGFKEKPDAWISPENSFVVQVIAAEIIESDRYKCGLTLRFPRVERVRQDKQWFECMSTTELNDLWQKSGGKLTGQHFQTEDVPVVKKKHLAPRNVKPSVAPQFQGADISDITPVSQIFAGKDICVINGSLVLTKAEVEKKIAEFGGNFVQNPDKDTFCVLADKVTVRIKNLMKHDRYNIIKLDWFVECTRQQRFIPWKPSDVIHATDTTRRLMDEDYDVHGDSFTIDCTRDSLKMIFDSIKQDMIDRSKIVEVEEKYIQGDNPFSLFRLCHVYLDTKSDPFIAESLEVATSPLHLTALDVRMYGASTCDSLDESVSHVIVDNRDLSRLDILRKIRRARQKKFHIVASDWVTDSVAQQKLCQERSYEPP